MRYAQLVMGPAGSGKVSLKDSYCSSKTKYFVYLVGQSTYCAHIQRHAADEKRVIDVVNLDPAAEHFDYQPLVDIRELIHVDDAMEDEELHFGPNGGLVFCIEYG